MTIHFKCGCFAVIFQDSVGEQLGLACCEQHEAPNQTLEKIGILEIDSIDIERPKTPRNDNATYKCKHCNTLIEKEIEDYFRKKYKKEVSRLQEKIINMKQQLRSLNSRRYYE